MRRGDGASETERPSRIAAGWGGGRVAFRRLGARRCKDRQRCNDGNAKGVAGGSTVKVNADADWDEATSGRAQAHGSRSRRKARDAGRGERRSVSWRGQTRAEDDDDFWMVVGEGRGEGSGRRMKLGAKIWRRGENRQGLERKSNRRRHFFGRQRTPPLTDLNSQRAHDQQRRFPRPFAVIPWRTANMIQGAYCRPAYTGNDIDACCYRRRRDWYPAVWSAAPVPKRKVAR